jgi:hypothetical protein
MAVAEAPHAFEGSEIMVKTPILHHQDDHMAHVMDRALTAVGRQGQRALNAGRKKASCGRSGGKPRTVSKKIAATVHDGIFPRESRL